MSMTMGERVTSGGLPGSFLSGWGRSRISWGSVFAGAIVAVATSILLSLLGAAWGANAISFVNTTSTDMARYGTGAGIWQIINVALSMALGGYVTSRLSGTHSHLDGELHGITMWGLTVLFLTVLLAQAASSLVGLVEQGAGTIAGGTASMAASAVGSASGTNGSQALVDRLQNALRSSGDPTTMTRDQLHAEITGLVTKSIAAGGLADPDRDRLVKLVAADDGVTPEEANRRVLRVENDAKAAVAQATQTAKEAADKVAFGTALAARALFTALVVGLLAALIGAWIGTRHKRILHPIVEHGPDIAPTPTYATPATGQSVVSPDSVHVYDETGRLLWQYLRGVSFPISKNELLRLAQTSNGGPHMVAMVEKLPERAYTSTSDVLGALGLAH